ncbi:hypothetical protein OSJ80_18280, partial [Mycobacterium ulcerans]
APPASATAGGTAEPRTTGVTDQPARATGAAISAVAAITADTTLPGVVRATAERAVASGSAGTTSTTGDIGGTRW